MFVSIYSLFTFSSECFYWTLWVRRPIFHWPKLENADIRFFLVTYRFGSANVLFMASTVMVPVGNLAFALPFVPGSTPLKDSDIAGLMVILLGLVTYRFGQSFNLCGWLSRRLRTIPPLPWRRGKTRYRRVPGILNDFEWDAPIFDDENESDLGVVQSSPSSFFLEEPLLPPIQ